MEKYIKVAPFFTEFENPALFSLLRSAGDSARVGISNPVKNRVLESCSNIFFLLGKSVLNYLVHSNPLFFE